MLGQEGLIERAIRAAAEVTGMEGTEVEKEIEEMTQLARQQKERFIRQMRLYYYKQVLLEDLASAGLPYVERMIMRRAIYFLPEDGFMIIVSKVRRAMYKGKAKLRKACKEVFLSLDRNVTIEFDDDEEAPEASEVHGRARTATGQARRRGRVRSKHRAPHGRYRSNATT